MQSAVGPVSLLRHLTLAALVAAAGCDRRFEGAGELRARRVVLEREVEGLRDAVQRLERGEPLLPPDDVAIAVEDTLVRELVAAQLPFDADVDRFHLRLAEVDVQFRGSPVVRLRGRLHVRDSPSLAAQVTLIGALERLVVDQEAGTLRAGLAADHLAIEEATGLTQWLSGATLDEVARTVRLEIASQLPAVEIPVRLRHEVSFAAVTRGPVRLAGARMPLEIAVSKVTATAGQLWVAVRVTPGAFVKHTDAPDAGDASAAETGAAIEDVTPAAPATATPAKGRGAAARPRP